MVLSAKVKVKQGTVAGGEDTLPNGTPYYYFRGIPYAEPPLGELRFKAPIPLERFLTPEIDCTKEGEVCFQKDENTGKILGSEDCLFLNVYAPKSKADEILPVMVYIHGGGFTFGSGNSDFYNPLYLMQEQVVVVTLNYRLGLLGFLSLPEANIPGNAGLKDQRLALQWVKDNISNFNGDPNNVTLFGESAGGACVHFHLLSENSRKLFHKAIPQSGLSNMPWALDPTAPSKTKKLAQSLGCTSDDPLEVAKFLQNYRDLNELYKPLFATPTVESIIFGLPLPVRPVIEQESTEAVITRSPFEVMNDENLIDIPVMMGITSSEGIVILPAFVNMLEDLDKDLRKFIPKDFNLPLEDPKSFELANLIKEFYFKGEKLNENTLDNLSDLLGDFFFIRSANEAAEIHSRKQHKSQLFFYRFDYVGALNLYKKIFQMENIKGVSHADDLFYIFQSSIAPEPWEEKAKKMVETTCKLWTNFAKYGNPTPKHDRGLINCTWEPVRKIGHKDDFTLNAFIIDEQQKMINNPNEERIDFWRNVTKTYNTQTIPSIINC